MKLRAGGCVTLLTFAGLLATPTPTCAEDRQVRPFIGAALGGFTTFVEPDSVFGKANLVVGGSAVFLGEVFGAEIDVSDVPGYFEGGDNLVKSSRVTTFSGNVVIAAPRKLTEYWLRPYLVAGGGVMRVSTTTLYNIFDISAVVPAFDVGAGVVGFVTNRTGVYWEVRRFQTLNRNPGRNPGKGLTFGPEYMSFWRASLGLALRY